MATSTHKPTHAILPSLPEHLSARLFGAAIQLKALSCLGLKRIAQPCRRALLSQTSAESRSADKRRGPKMATSRSSSIAQWQRFEETTDRQFDQSNTDPRMQMQ
jgi:hypothetical protein